MKRNGEIHSDRSSVTWPLDPVSDPVGRAERAIPRARRSREEKQSAWAYEKQNNGQLNVATVDEARSGGWLAVVPRGGMG